MPDLRRHRGPHPEDPLLFAAEWENDLRAATRDLSWLLTRHYASPSAIKVVGDRYALNARQRVAIARCACGDQQLTSRRQRQVEISCLQQQQLWIDAYNVLTSVEAALSGGVILEARDGCYRDMASMHGSYRKVEETVPAISIVGDVLARWGVTGCRWLLDAPVSNSGRLKTMLRETGQDHGWNWDVELVANPDTLLVYADSIVASADSHVLDHAPRWFNLAREAIDLRVPSAWKVDLSQ